MYNYTMYYIFEGDNANILLLNEASLPVGLARRVVTVRANTNTSKAHFMASMGLCTSAVTSGPCSDLGTRVSVAGEDLGLGLSPSLAAAGVAAGGGG